MNVMVLMPSVLSSFAYLNGGKQRIWVSNLAKTRILLPRSESNLFYECGTIYHEVAALYVHMISLINDYEVDKIIYTIMVCIFAFVPSP